MWEEISQDMLTWAVCKLSKTCYLHLSLKYVVLDLSDTIIQESQCVSVQTKKDKGVCLVK